MDRDAICSGLVSDGTIEFNLPKLAQRRSIKHIYTAACNVAVLEQGTRDAVDATKLCLDANISERIARFSEAALHVERVKGRMAAFCEDRVIAADE